MGDYALQRKNMVESQVRPSDVTDRRIIRAMSNVPREVFVPAGARPMAYMDDAIPLHDSRTRGLAARTLMAPRTFAKLLVLADFEDGDRVLIVGSGCGYSAAVIAEIVTSVVGVESDAALLAAARTAVATLPGVTASRISFHKGELAAGVADRGPYDVIVLEGAVPELPPALMQQLSQGGRCVGVEQRGTVGHATVWRRVGETFAALQAFEANACKLPGFAKPATFAL